MKLSKVEIQAFRIYDKAVDGTFDFHTDKGEIADFVAVFAPNGFGKTSFYDAIEWGFTNRVHRLNNEELIRKDRDEGLRQGTVEGRNILRHKETQVRPTYVRISRDVGEPVYNAIIKRPRKDSTDMDLGTNGDAALRPFFKKILLEQEAIDAFLRVVKPHEKYAEWASYFSDDNIEAYYKTIWNLLTVNDEEIGKCEKDLKGLELNGTAPDVKLLTNINEQISLLADHGLSLRQIDDTFDYEAWIDLTARLNDQLVNTRSDLDKENSKAENIQIALEGSPEIINVRTFLTLPTKINTTKAELQSLEQSEKLFDAVAANEERLTELKSEISERNIDLSRLRDLLKRYPEFARIEKSIIETQSSLKQIEDKRRELEVLIESAEEDLITADGALQETERSLLVVRSSIEEYPQTKSDLDKLEADRKRLQGEKDLLDKKLDGSRRKEITALQLRVTSIARIRDEINNNNFQIKPDAILEPVVNSVLKGLRELELEASKLGTDISQIEGRIASLNVLASEVEQLVTLGLSIAHSVDESTCPLCNHDYGSHQDLIGRLQISSTLNKDRAQLVNDKKEKSSRLKEIKSDMKKLKAKTTQELETRIVVAQVEIEEKLKEIDNLNVHAQACVSELLNINSRIAARSSAFLGLEPEQFLKQARKKIRNLTSRQSVEKSKKEDLKSNLLRFQEQATIEISRLEKAEAQLKSLESSLPFVAYRSDLANLGVDPSDSNVLKAKISDLTTVQQNLVKESASLLKEIETNRSKLPKITRTRLATKLDLLRDQLNDFESQRSAFERLLKEKIGLKSDDPKLQQRLAEVKKSVAVRKRSLQALSDLLEKIQLNQKSVRPFLRYWTIQKQREELGKQLKKKIRLRTILEAERTRLSGRLEQSVVDFFDEDLINSIYQAIDPHPVYNTVKFICRFQEIKPTLDVVVRDNNDSAIPNLYFSSAQINVLSLSIFLARALRAVSAADAPIKCIFIDDPIQSMDSINILSTIDLMRSIVLNKDIQIILSTHDENFYDLLKRKIPTNRFRSKFIELETYGKVRGPGA